MTVQDALRELRHEMGLSQESFARKLGTTLRTVSRFERETPPRGKRLVELAVLATEADRLDLRLVFLEALTRQLNLGAVGWGGKYERPTTAAGHRAEGRGTRLAGADVV